MAQLLRQNTGTSIVVGPLVSATTGLPVTDAVLTAKLLQQDSPFPVTLASTGTHIADGMYAVAVTTSESNVPPGRVMLWVSAAGVKPLDPVRFQCVSKPVFDAATASTALSASSVADAVWASGSRTLSNAPANFSSLAITPQGRVTVGSNVDKSGYSVVSVGTEAITSGSFAANAIDGNALAASAASEVANTLLDQPNGVETNMTLRQALRLVAAVLFGRVSGAEGSTLMFRNAVADTKTRVTATTDSNGNRTSVTTDAT